MFRVAIRDTRHDGRPVMPLFFFHLRTPGGLDVDDLGIEFASLEAAYLDVCATIPDMAVETVRRGVNPMPFTFVIADATGAELMVVPFAERLRDGRAPARPRPSPGVSDLAHNIEGGRRLVAAMRAEVAGLFAEAEASREAMRRTWVLLRDGR